MQSAAADHLAVELRDPEFLDRFVERHQVLLQQNLARVAVDQALDGRNVGRSGPPDHEPVIGSVAQR